MGGGSRARPVACGRHQGRKRACTRDALGTRPEAARLTVGGRSSHVDGTSDAELVVGLRSQAISSRADHLHQALGDSPRSRIPPLGWFTLAVGNHAPLAIVGSPSSSAQFPTTADEFLFQLNVRLAL